MKRKVLKISLVSLFVVFGVGTSLFVTRMAGACSWWNGCDNNATFAQESNAVEKNQSRLINVEPIPYLTDSQERKNLIKRATTFNNPNKISYIYLYSFGKLIMYDTVKGKVSSVDSSLTSQTQVVDDNSQPAQDSNCGTSRPCFTVPAPAVDGSYGTNGTSIFYFNENGAYREWHGEYILSDQPLILTNQPDLVKQVK